MAACPSYRLAVSSRICLSSWLTLEQWGASLGYIFPVGAPGMGSRVTKCVAALHDFDGRMGSIFTVRILLRLGHFVDCHFVAIMMETLYFEGILFPVGAPGMGSRVEFK